MKYKLLVFLMLTFCFFSLFACSLSSNNEKTKTSSYNTSSYDVDSYNVNSVVVSGESVIIEEGKVKDIALSKFHLSENSVKIDTISLTTEGTPVYTVDFIKDNTAYTCSIDATSGEVISSEQTPINEISSSSTPVKKNGYVEEEYVKQLVLARLDQTSTDNIVINFNEDAKQYEGNIQLGNNIYSFIVNAINGEFIDWKISKAQ